jgi:REP element-mobilizing transposase RayT
MSQEATTNHHCKIHGYVLLTNHVHLLLNQCRVLGSERFKDEIEAALSRRVRPANPGRPKVKVESKAEIPV